MVYGYAAIIYCHYQQHYAAIMRICDYYTAICIMQLLWFIITVVEIFIKAHTIAILLYLQYLVSCIMVMQPSSIAIIITIMQLLCDYFTAICIVQ